MKHDYGNGRSVRVDDIPPVKTAAPHYIDDEGEGATPAPNHASLAYGHQQRLEQLAAELGATTAPVAAGNVAGREPEFVRVPDLRSLAGLKRGFVYGKIKDGTFRSISLREPGKQFGVRLVYWPSVKNWLLSLMAKQNPDNA